MLRWAENAKKAWNFLQQDPVCATKHWGFAAWPVCVPWAGNRGPSGPYPGATACTDKASTVEAVSKMAEGGDVFGPPCRCAVDLFLHVQCSIRIAFPAVCAWGRLRVVSCQIQGHPAWLSHRETANSSRNCLKKLSSPMHGMVRAMCRVSLGAAMAWGRLGH